MADVTGRIGTDDVELNNAATEATLRQLLQATIAAGTKNTAALTSLAQQSGLNPAAIQQANAAVQQIIPQMNALGRASFMAGAALSSVKPTVDEVINLSKKLASGNAQASDVFQSLSKLPGPLGMVAAGLQQVAQFQEQQMTHYQNLTKVGINFGGSLTDLRMAASQTYMGMTEFANLMKANGEVFSRMGGTVDQGAKAFVKASNTLLSSDAGKNLRALGYTTEEVNQGMLNYIAVTGGRSKKEMQDTEALAKSTQAYLVELDELSSITGKSKEELQKKLKEEMEEAEFQLFLSTKSKAEREAIEASVKRATALYGKGGADVAKAQAQGLAVYGEAGKKFTALSAGAAESVRNDVEIRKRGGDQTKALQANEIAGRKANAESMSQYAGGVASVGRVLKGNEDAVKLAARDRIAGEKEIGEQYSEIAREREEREKGQAAAAAESKKAIDELGQKILAGVLPIVEKLMVGVNEVVSVFAKFPGVTAAVLGGFVAWKAWMAANKAKDFLSSILTGGAAGGSPGGGLPGGTVPGGGAGGAGGAAGRAGGLLSGVGPAMRGAAAGLRAFANPMVLAGAAGFGAAIAAIGAGIAGASWLVGKALPTLAEGFMKFTEIDGAKLGSSAFGIAKLGLGLIPFAPVAIWGMPAGLGLSMIGDGLVKMASVDPAKLEKVANAMEKIKAATPNLTDSLKAGVAGLVTKFTGPAEATPTAPGAPATAQSTETLINLINEVKQLNTITGDMLRYSKETADQSRRTVEAIRALKGDLF